MRRLVSTVVFFAVLGCAAPAFADDAAVETGLTPVPIEVRWPDLGRRANARPAIRTSLYVLQAVDAVLTSVALRRERRYEANPMLGPFSHGGIATIALGFATGDLVRARLFRRAPRLADSLDGIQALSNADGIRTTLRSLHAP